MVEVVLLIAAVMVGLVVVMRMDVEPREPSSTDEPTEPAVADGGPTVPRGD